MTVDLNKQETLQELNFAISLDKDLAAGDLVEYYVCFGANVCQIATFTTDEIRIHYGNI